jgi:signal transduction histidine kinase
MRVLVVFTGVIGAFSCVLAWLGWQFLENSRSIEDRRVQQELADSADHVAATLKQTLQTLQSASPFQKSPAGVVWFSIEAGRVKVEPPNAIAYYPALPATDDVDGAFADAEILEFRDRKPGDAAIAYRLLAQSPRPDIRAGALARLGRALRACGRSDEALAVFAQLALIQNAWVEHLPAEMAARESRCRVFEALGRRAELRREASMLQEGLRANRWTLLRPEQEFYTREAARWGGKAAADDSEVEARTLAAGAAWAYEHRDFSSPVILQVVDKPVLAVRISAGGQLRGAMGSPSFLRAALRTRDPLIECALLDRNGHVLAGYVHGNSSRSLRPTSATGLPWDVAASFRNPEEDMANYAARRRVLMFGFGVVTLVLAAGSYYIVRSILREQALARLQSNFVAAVSHELRTPLSSIVQISEMLAAERIPEGEMKAAFEHLLHEGGRLRKLVESLLDFGRMESGAARYQREPVEVTSFVHDTVAEFLRSAACDDHRIEVKGSGELPNIRADRQALSLAVWNLLDNAVKYSPRNREIEVILSTAVDRVTISVRDQGLGIPRSEQQQVFGKFFRGSASRAANVKGTGIGLAIVRHVAAAHGGEIALTSEPGRGSTFTLRLPAEEI